MDNASGPVEAESGRSAPLRLLDAVRERLRYMHHTLRTEEAYVYWVRGFVQWSGLRHPREMGVTEVRGFLTMLASERRVAAATHRQALSAPLFLYREVVGIDMPWLQELGRFTRGLRADVRDRPTDNHRRGESRNRLSTRPVAPKPTATRPKELRKLAQITRIDVARR